jgi:hypothetical protein
MRVAAEVVLTKEQRCELERFVRGRKTQVRLVLRARIVLLAADRHTDLEIAEGLNILPRTAARWRARFLKLGVAGLEHDAPRPGRAPEITAEVVLAVIEKTTRQKPPNRTHWSIAHDGRILWHQRSQRTAHLASAWPQAASHPHVQA